jgi:hypothetical protein
MADRANSSDRVRQQVLDYMFGALDDSEMEVVRARLESDPVYRQAMRRANSEMVRLQGLGRHAAAPPHLAGRTCEYVFDPLRRLRGIRCRRSMTPASALPQCASRLSWADMGVATLIFAIAGLLIIPAVNGMRYQSRVTACKDNLRQVGQALAEYSHRNNELFPLVPAEGNLAVAGIYAPILAQNGFLTEPERVLCPDSAQAGQKGFRFPSLDELRSSAGQGLSDAQQKMGGSYGYCLGYFDNGVYTATRNLNRVSFALMADAPSPDRPYHQSASHGGLGQNVLFEDLHVEFCSTTRPGDGADDIFANDNNEVAPGLHRNDAVIAPSGTGPNVFVSLPSVRSPLLRAN